MQGRRPDPETIENTKATPRRTMTAPGLVKPSESGLFHCQLTVQSTDEEARKLHNSGIASPRFM